MPNLETPDELAEVLADWLGIYRDSRCDNLELATKDETGDTHIDRCDCRVWWTYRMTLRIRKSVANEVLLGNR